MKVILLRDVAKIGRRFEIVEVPDGFALNKLIPQKDAEPASPANVKRIQEKNKNSKLVVEGEVASIKAIHLACVEAPLIIEMEANEQGHLFQSVHAGDIVASAKARSLIIPLNFLRLKESIKSLGDHDVELVAQGESLALPIKVIAKQK
jgi:large subunit ribosomal protein L9